MNLCRGGAHYSRNEVQVLKSMEGHGAEYLRSMEGLMVPSNVEMRPSDVEN